MSAVRHANTRRPAPIRESASRDADELAWPPSIDDLNAIEVVPLLAAYATELKTHRPPAAPIVRPSLPPLPQPLARQPASSQTPSLPGLPDLLAVHDLAGADADTFRSEAVQGPAAADGLPQSAERGRSWTRMALYAAASVVVLTTMYPFVWTPTVSPDLPQVADFSSTAPSATPMAPVEVREAAVQTASDAEARPSALVAPVEPRQADGGAPRPATVPVPLGRPAPAAPREPVQLASRPESQRAIEPASQRVLVPASQRVPEPESQRVLQPDAQSARPVETMARSTVPVVVPPGALPTAEMAPTPATAPRDAADAAPAAPVPPIPPIRTASVPERTDDVGVQAALRRYESAYSRLDARAAQAVWPSVDARALERAFESLESQSLQFDRCELDVRETVAKADCLGTATYVRRIGSKAPRTEPRAWTFNLRKTGDAWHILSAAAR